MRNQLPHRKQCGLRELIPPTAGLIFYNHSSPQHRPQGGPPMGEATEYSGKKLTIFMFESKDILNYALTLFVLVLTFFTAWILYYVLKIVGQMRRLIKDITRAIEKFSNVLDYAKEKMSNMAAIIPLMIKGSEKIVEMVTSLKEKKSNSRKKKGKTKTQKHNNSSD